MLKICRISCRLQERFKPQNAVVTGLYEILHVGKGTKNLKTLDMNVFGDLVTVNNVTLC